MHGQTDWRALRHEVLETFTPGPSINEIALFAGRKNLIQRLQDTVIERARHAIIFGERGVGKTSLANIFYKDLHTETRPVRDIDINVDSGDSFDSLWRKVFRRIRWPGDDRNLDMFYPGAIEPDHVVLEFAKFPQNEAPIIIVDEYDRITDDMCRVLNTDLIKALTKSRNNPTIVLVGVADNIIDLVRDHASITRHLVQIPMARMSNEEIREVITSRVRRLRMKITDDAVWRITYFSSGLPFYAHSLGKYSALTAIETRKLDIDEKMVLSSTERCMADLDHTVAEAYERATEKIYNKDNMFAKVLAACALAETNSLGQFSASAIEGPLSAIVGSPTARTAFSFHLNEMSGSGRGNVLRKTGERRTFQYHFTEAAMQPYIIMRSLKDEVITRELFEKHYVRRQTVLPI